MGKFADNTPETDKETLGRVADLLKRHGISVDDVGAIKRVSLYQSITKNKEGEAETHDLMGIQFSPLWETGPVWEPVHQGPAVKFTPPKAVTTPRKGLRVAVVLPDMQMGYFRDAHGVLEAIHDEKAIGVALKITKAAKPDQVVLVGDNLDLCEFGKYRMTPAFRDTTQATIDRATVFGAELRSAAPNAELTWLAGNHEERLPNMLIDNSVAAFGLRQGNAPASFPVMSVPFLCRFDDFGITYKPGYPAGIHWITERLHVIHGNKVASGGSTAHKYLATQKTSVIYGHIHRREWAERTRRDWDGPKTIMAASPGCLARTDGVVPSTGAGIDLDGRPVTSQEDWQQGIGVVTYDPTSGEFWYEQVPIRDGVAMWRGKFYAS